MTLLIRRTAADGARLEQSVEGEVTVGRATDNTVQLSGLLVALRHLRLKPISNLRLHAECVSAADITVNGMAGQRAAELVAGDEIRIGPHVLHFGVDGDEPRLVLEVREQDSSHGADPTEAITSLAEAGWRMRRPAYWGAGVVLLLLFLLPLLLRLFSAPEAVGRWVPSDRLWSSGQVSNAHAQFQNRCEVCHEGLFQQVRDSACLTCHQGIAHHGDDPKAMHTAGLDGRSCASCHYEHGGPHAVLPRHPATCTGCHASPTDFAALVKTGAVTDFANGHPAFKVHLSLRKDGVPRQERQVLGPKVRDQSGLIFPHDLHLDAKGVRGPDGREVLSCASCHVPGVGQVGFRPIRFESDCQRCHQLDVDLNGLPFRLPHGDSDAVRSLMQAAVSAKPLAETSDAVVEEESRRRPGERADRGDGRSTLGEVDEIFDRRVCAKCHEIARTEGAPLAVLKPQLSQSWMTQARFTHAPHQWVACDVCHAAKTSANSDDLMLPQIETCRSCHGGVDSTGQIQSTCIDCHRFHQAATLQMGKSTGTLANGSSQGRGK
jgi:predicted CXXCH cytochrome family protein